MKHIDAHQNAVMLEHSFEDCWNLSVGDQLPRGAHRLIEPTVPASLSAARKKPAGEQSHLTPLLHDRLIGSTRCEFRLMHLPLKALEALHTRHEFAL
jgi:hypothetical protein